MSTSEEFPNPELGTFLRARRHSLPAIDTGQPLAQRREPGMRQEDVARLAGMSVRHYAALERGELPNPAHHLDAVARALEMDAVARHHLYRLATGHEPPGSPDPVDEPPLQKVRPVLRDYVTLLEPAPAYVTDAAWNILIWNAGVAEWFVDLARLPAAERNVVRWTFTPQAANRLVDVDQERRLIIARLRSEQARYPGDERFDTLIRRLLDSHAEARELWARQETAANTAPSMQTVVHPSHGVVNLSGVLTELPGGLRITVFIPPRRYLGLTDNGQATSPRRARPAG
jgi:transcriptional regulator with XRE-family HTH domain